MGEQSMTYTIEKATDNLRAKIQRAIDEFHEESGRIYAPSVYVANTPVTTMGQSVHRHISKVDVELELRTV
jgi:hypothetical protein